MLCILVTLGCQPVDTSPGYVGYVEAELYDVAAPRSGWIVEMPVREGDVVKTDTLLFELDSDYQKEAQKEAASHLKQAEANARDLDTGAREEEIAALEAQLKEANATLHLARDERLRWTRMAEENIASEARRDQAVAQELEAEARVERLATEIDVARLPAREGKRAAAEAGRDAAAAALNKTEWELSQRVVLARREGHIEEVNYRLGEYVTVGSLVLSILPPDSLKIRFFVPQHAVGQFSPGDTIRVRSDDAPEPVAATISFIAREAEFTPPVIYSIEARDKLVFLIEAHLEDSSSLRPGQPVDVLLP